MEIQRSTLPKLSRPDVGSKPVAPAVVPRHEPPREKVVEQSQVVPEELPAPLAESTESVSESAVEPAPIVPDGEEKADSASASDSDSDYTSTVPSVAEDVGGRDVAEASTATKEAASGSPVTPGGEGRDASLDSEKVLGVGEAAAAVVEDAAAVAAAVAGAVEAEVDAVTAKARRIRDDALSAVAEKTEAASSSLRRDLEQGLLKVR